MSGTQSDTTIRDAAAANIDRTPCPCGSGLRRVRCCGLDAASQPDPANHEALAPLVEAMKAARAAGRSREAERTALRLLDLAPLHREGLRLLYELRRAETRLRAAETLIARLAALEPQTAIAHVQHAQLLMAQGRHTEAEAPARAAVGLAPRDSTVHHQLGILFTESGRLSAGERHYRIALGLAGRQDAGVIGNLAWNLKQQGRLDDAAELYRTVIAAKPDNARALAGFAQVQAARGEAEAAEAMIAKARELVPSDRMIALLAALARLHRGDPDGAIARIDETARMIGPQSLVATEHALKGQALERLGRTGEAFAAYRAGRDMQRERAGRRFDPAPIAAKLAGLRAAFTADRLAMLPRAMRAPGQAAPVFLLGVPRSGTSLLEDLLSRVQCVDAADTRGPLGDLATLLPHLVAGLGGPVRDYPAALGDVIAGEPREILPMLSARYLSRLATLGITTAETSFVTDRDADLCWHLGLAALLFPDAPVIHVLRHPLDVVLSRYAQDRLGLGNAGVTLESLGRLYDAEMQAIAHVRGQITLRYLPVRYEDLVEAPAATLARVLDFAGIAADAHATVAAAPRRLNRAPTWQVIRENLHHRGRFRHRGFGDVFGEVQPIVRPWIESLGYDTAELAAA